MLLGQQRRKCREETGPTPHSVSVRAKLPSLRPVDRLIQQRQKQDASRDRALEFTKRQQNSGVKTSWLKSADGRFVREDIKRQVCTARNQQDAQIQERRSRLRALLTAEDLQLLKEMEEKVETSEERQTKMSERATALREQRERERQRLVSDKLDQHFREQCAELRTIQSQRAEQQVCSERSAQVRSRQEQLRRRRQEERMFDELWEADWRAKEEREAQRAEGRQQRNLQQLDSIRNQMEAGEEERRRQQKLREEESKLRLQQQETWRLQQQRERNQKLLNQQKQRRQLDEGLRLKMKRLAREQQDELQLDMNVLQELLRQDTDEKQGAAQRKAELHEEQQRHRRFLSDELQRQKEEELETELLIEERLKEVLERREEQCRMRREASDRLMKEVMEARSLQIQRKLDMNQQHQLELSKDGEEMNRMMEEMKLMDEEEKRDLRESREAHQADLRAQMKQRQQLHWQRRAEAQREYQQGLIQQQLYNQRKEEILSRPSSHNVPPHPFRAGGAAGISATPHLT
ncbi:cilia- and flagella-associated protein 53 [Brachionichthys hirsutus]|uniref:cilia- and flagella-associated protein 53 n=1 Tax=Brachionichthys hirsutus TaxID=412623 RepID=UPI003605006F